MTTAARMQALLDLVEADRAQRCQALTDQARAQARAALATARQQARAQLREAFAEAREHRARQLAAARAELQTHRRLQAQRQTEALLAQAWQRLPALLAARWQDAAARARWTEAALAGARAALPHDAAWTVHHPADWPTAERDAVTEALQAAGLPPPQWQPDHRLVAGLKITATGNVVDATVTGLLADRDDIGGRLIGLLADEAEAAA